MNVFFQSSKVLCFLLLVLYSGAVTGQETKLPELEQQLERALNSKDNGKVSYYSYEIAKVHRNMLQADKAMEYFAQCISYGNKAADHILVYLAHQQMGSMFTEEKNHKKALSNFQKALKLARQMGKGEFVSEGLIDVAVSYQHQGRHKKSIEPLKEALSSAIKDGDVLTQLRCYELLVASYKKSGDKGKSEEYRILHDNIIQNQQKEVEIEHQLNELEAEKEQQVSELEDKVEQVNIERRSKSRALRHQSEKLRNTEDSLLATKYSLEETEQSLKLAQEISDNQQLQIDLLNKSKELSELQIKEQESRLKNAALIRNSIIIVALLATTLVIVMIRSYRKKIEANKEIDRQNKNIKSSINYAKRIQEAMLHRSDLANHNLPDSFVLFKPRDSVSGDFYWVSEIKNWYDPDVVFAAVDCTGHGIPGAFMSMIGMNALNGIITQGIAESDQMLDALDKEIRTALQQETTGNKDGMDIALCIYRKEKGIIEFSGAKNPLIYIQNKELFQIKGDVHAIGGINRKSKKKFSYKKHIVPIDQPTTIYLFSDGYQDQFGGEENMKFMSKRFKKLLLDIHHLPMTEQMEILNTTIEAWKGDHKQTDDILVMGIRLDNELDI